MADKKISNLTELTTPASTDLLAIVDISASETKKITFSNLEAALTLDNLNGTLGASKGGTGLDTSGSTGIPKVSSGTWSIDATQDDLPDGTTYKQYNPASVAITGGTINGINVSNLLDKTANETITGNWTFSNTPTFSDVSRARAYRDTSAQSIAASTNVKVELNAESYDEQGEFDSSTNYRFTATKAGYYLVCAAIEYAGMDDGVRYKASIYKNGTEVARNYQRAGGTGSQAVTISDIVYLAAGDYLELWTKHESSGAQDISYGSALTFMAIHKLS